MNTITRELASSLEDILLYNMRNYSKDFNAQNFLDFATACNTIRALSSEDLTDPAVEDIYSMSIIVNGIILYAEECSDVVLPGKQQSMDELLVMRKILDDDFGIPKNEFCAFDFLNVLGRRSSYSETIS